MSNSTYNGMDAKILAQIAEKEQQYKAQPHTGTRCALLNAYGEAAGYAVSNGAPQAEVYQWHQKACTLAENGAQAEPCFVSYWDAAVVSMNCGEFCRAANRTQEARQRLKCAAAYLEEILDKKLESPVENCDPASLLREVYFRLTALV